jgi:acyl-CoA reductase-like NAD-dependent aldehyde dehydrogenase
MTAPPSSTTGGDFAAVVGAGNPVIVKAHTSHPRTTQIFAEEALLCQGGAVILSDPALTDVGNPYA